MHASMTNKSKEVYHIYTGIYRLGSISFCHSDDSTGAKGVAMKNHSFPMMYQDFISEQ